MYIPQWSEARSSEEEDIKCIRKSRVETVNEEMKGSSSEEENIGIRKCRIRIQVEIMNEEVKGWTSSSKKQEAPPEITKIKEVVCLEKMKVKVKRAAL